MRIAYGTYLTWATVRRASIQIGIPAALAVFPILPWWLRAIAALVALDAAWAHVRVIRAMRMFTLDTHAHEQCCGVVLDRLAWDGRGRLLDIGTGAGLVAIGAAKRFTGAEVVGTDTWSAGFIGLTRAACVRNAEIEGVARRVRFEFADAAALPYPDGAFDAVISNSVFHLVAGGGYPALREALRVLRPGGVFAFSDPFEIPVLYGSIDQLIRRIREDSCSHITYAPMETLTEVPRAMLHLTVGVGVLSGRKTEQSSP